MTSIKFVNTASREIVDYATLKQHSAFADFPYLWVEDPRLDHIETWIAEFEAPFARLVETSPPAVGDTELAEASVIASEQFEQQWIVRDMNPEELSEHRNILHMHAKAKREEKIDNGTTFDGISIKGDTRTQVFMSVLHGQAQANSGFFYEGYRAENGIFDLTAAQIIGLFQSGIVHVATCFGLHNAAEKAIDDGNITSKSAIDTLFN